MIWNVNTAGNSRLQLATDSGITNIIADSTTANAYYVSTNTLANGTTYWWRAADNANNWSSTSSFAVDIGSPTFSSPQVSTNSATGPWTNLPTTSIYMSSNVVTVRVAVQDTVAGLEVSTGLPTGLIGQWHFDESSGTLALDASANGNNGVLVPSTMTWTTGKRGSGLSFDTSNSDGVTLTNSANLFNANPLTIMAWVNPSNINQTSFNGSVFGATIIDGDENGGTSGYVFGIRNTGVLWWWPSSGNDKFSTGTIPLNVWTHVTLTYDGTNVRMYINGLLDSTQAAATPQTPTFLKIGARSWITGAFAGVLDEVSLYNVALTSAQVLNAYQSDSLAAQARGAAYDVLYSTNSGATWNFISTNSVTLTGGNGTTGSQTLQAANVPLVTSTGPAAHTDLVEFVASDMAGNVSTVTYTVLVDTVVPALASPANGAFVSTSTPVMTWATINGGNGRLQLATDSGFVGVIADSTTANAYYVSTNTLTNGATYWWRVADALGSWSTTASFTIDLSSPGFSSPQVSTNSATGPWTNLPTTSVYMSSNVVTVSATVQDTVAGLEVSTGLPTGLIGQWHFDDSSGTVALDASTNAFNGALQPSTMTWVAGKRGNALSFSGGSDVLISGHLGNPTSISLCAWANLTTAGTAGSEIISLGDHVALRLDDTTPNNGLKGFYYDGTTYHPTHAPLFYAGTGWHHFCYTVDTVNHVQAVYADGLSKATSTFNTSISYSGLGANTLIGVHGNGQTSYNFTGAIDEVRAFSVALSSGQVLAEYQSDTLAAQYNSAAYSVYYSTNAGSTWNFVSTNSVTLTGGNGTTGSQTLQAANVPLVTSTGPAAHTDLVEFVASDMAGNVSTAAYTILVDTTVPPAPPGCGVTVNVMKTPPGPSWYTTIQSAVSALPTSLGSNACVVIRDTQTYSEQVTIQGFTATGGYTGNLVQIMSDSSFISSAPVVDPPVNSTAAFQILNSSVNILNIIVNSTNSVPYGISASSSYVTISSVNVIDPGGSIYATGISLSNYSALSYSSVTVHSITPGQGLYGIYLNGAVLSSVSYSTVANNNSGNGDLSLYLNGGSSNTITHDYISGGNYGATLNASSNNTISYSTFTVNGGQFDMRLTGSSSKNTILQDYFFNLSGDALELVNGNNNYNTISQSTFVAGGSPTINFHNSPMYNTLSNLLIVNTGAGQAVTFNLGSNFNTLAFSTITSNSGVAIQFGNGFSISSDTITNCYVQGSTAVYITNGSTGVVIGGSVLVATGNYSNGVYMDNTGNTNLTLSSDTIQGGASGAGVFIDQNNSGIINLSTNTLLSGPQFAVLITTQTSGTQVWITSNTIVPSISSSKATYALLLNGLTSGATIQNNGFYYRSPASGPSGSNGAFFLYAKSSTRLMINHNRFNNPGMVTGGNHAAIVFNGAYNNVLQFNDVNSTGTNFGGYAFLFDFTSGSTGTVVKDNVLLSSFAFASSGSSATLIVDAASQAGFVSNYNDWYSSNSFTAFNWGGTSYQGLAAWQTGVSQDLASISSNPLWANTGVTVEDFHPLSSTGRYNPATNAFVADGAASPTIDAADPAQSLTAGFSLPPAFLGAEPVPNGNAANQGSYGQTDQASMSTALSLLGPANGAAVSTGTPLLVWSNATGSTRLQLATNSSFTSLVADSTTANSFYISPNALTNGQTYWWRARPSSGGSWPAVPFSFTEDRVSPILSNAQITTNSATGPWNAVGGTLSTSVVSIRITAQDANSGLSVSLATPPNLLTQWHFDEPNGPYASDASTQGDSGILNGVITHVPGIKGGGALNFDGASGYVYGSKQSAGPQTFTLELWFKSTTTAGGLLLGFGDKQFSNSATHDRNVYMDNNGRVFFGVYPGSVKTVNSSAIYNDGNWHFAAATLSGAGMALYMDGNLVAANPSVTSAQSYNGYWRAGQDNLGGGWTNAPSNGTYFFNGAIDEVRVFGVALSSAQIIGDYESDALAAQNQGQPYNVLYSTNAGANWNYVPTANVTLSGSNGSAAAQTLQANSIPLAPGPGNQIEISAADMAGNVSTAVYTVSIVDASSPTLVMPASGGYVSLSTPTFSWTNVVGVVANSRLQVAKDSGFTNVVADTSVVNNFFVSTAALSDATTYWWRVQNLDDSNWSSSWTFVTDLQPPAFSAPQVTTNPATGPWVSLPLGAPLSTATASVRVTMQDANSGLLVSTGLPAGLIGQWHLDEANGLMAADASTQADNGVISNVATHVPGIQGNALNFDGTGVSRVFIPYSAALDLNLQPRWTMSAWIKPASYTNATYDPTIYAYGWYTATLGLNFGTGKLESWINGGSEYIANTAVPLNQWSHVVLTYGGGGMVFYLNGRQDSVFSGVPAVASDTGGSGIGDTSNPSSGNFNGTIDEVRVFNVALSSAQVAAMYEADNLAAHNRGRAYGVLYSTNAGSNWNYVSTNSVSLSGANGTTGAQTLEADNISLSSGTGNEIEIVASDLAGNVSTAVYTIPVLDASTPALIVPYSGSYVNLATMTFLWTNTVGAAAANSRLQVAKDSGFTSVVTDTNVLVNSFTSTRTLADATTYWWRVQNLDNSNWSSTWTFVTDLLTPSFSAPQVTTNSATGPWLSLPLAGPLTASTASVRVTVSDANSGLLVSTGPPNGLIAQWHFDEPSGSALDASTNAYNGTAAGNVARIAGVEGGGVNTGAASTAQLQSQLNYIAVPAISVGSNYTVEVWSKFPLPVDYGNELLCNSGTDNCEIVVWNNNLEANWTASQYSVSGLTGWHHLAAVASGGVTNFYMDGQWATSVNSVVTDAIDTVGGDPKYMGYEWGAFDELRIYNIALSSSQILADYESDTIAALARGKAYNVLYSSNAGATWNFVSTNSVSLGGANGTTASQTLEADGIQLSTGPGNQIELIVSDVAGNVSTTVYTIPVADVSTPTLLAPSNAAAISVSTPAFVWSNVIGVTANSRLQVAKDSAFTTIAVDTSVIANSFISTVALTNATTYWWRVQNLDDSLWSSTFSFVEDLSPPVFSSPQVSTAAGGPWNSLNLGVYLSSTIVTAQITAQDPVSGLMVSTGLPAGLIAQWHFDEASGVTALDASTQAANGTLNGGITRASGVKGNALNFDGFSGYVSFPASLQVSSPPVTIEMWVNPNTTSPVGLFDSAPGQTNVIRNYFAGNVEWWNGNPSVPLNLSTGAWQHIALIFRLNPTGNRVIDYYKNGLFQTESVGGVNSTLAWTTFRLGNINGGTAGWYNGLMDEARIYNVVLSSAQILNDYQSDTLTAQTRTTAYNVLYSTTAGATWNYVSTNSVTIGGANGTNAAQVIRAANVPFVPTASAGAPTNQIEFTASDMAGNVSTASYVVYVDTTAPPLPAGCAGGANVSKSSSGPSFYATIQDAVNSLSASLSGNACVVIRDTQTYNEQVTVQGFAPAGGYAGNLIQIMADPNFVSSAPVINPPAASTAAFQILNSSVALLNLAISPMNSVPYGISASSSYIAISSVSIQDPAGSVKIAGILLASTSAAVSYSSVTTLNADGLYVTGSSNTVSYSSMTLSGPAAYAVHLLGASYNQFSVVFASNTGGYGVFLDTGSNANAISSSTLSGTGTTGYGLGVYLRAAATNTFSNDFLLGNGPKGAEGASIDLNSNYNKILLSTCIGSGNGSYTAYYYAGFDIDGSSNTVKQSYLYSPGGVGIAGDGLSMFGNYNQVTFSTAIGGGDSYEGAAGYGGIGNVYANDYFLGLRGEGVYEDGVRTSISFSTMIGQGQVYGSGLMLQQTSSDAVTNCYIQGSTGVYIDGSTGTVLGGNAIAAPSAGGIGVYADNANNLNISLTSNTITGGAQGAGIYISSANMGLITLSTNVITGSQYGVFIATQASGAQIWIASNTVIPVISNAARNDYGLYLNGLNSGATIYNNGIYLRGPTAAGPAGANSDYALYVVSSSSLTIHHNRISNPGLVNGGNFTGVYFNGVTKTSFLFNDVNSTGTGLGTAYLMQLAGSTVSIRDDIFLSSITATSSATLIADAGSGFTSDYNDFYSSNSANTMIWGGVSYQFSGGWAGQDTHSIAANPLWSNVISGVEDFHPKSTQGRCYDPGGSVNILDPTAACPTWQTDGADSPTIDKADPPPQDYSLESTPNGYRANQGSYGDTVEASETNTSSHTFFWSGVTNTTWTVSSNWIPSGPPGVYDVVVIDTNGANQPAIYAPVTIANLFISTGGVYTSTLTVDSPLTVTSSITVGSKGYVTHDANGATKIYISSITTPVMMLAGTIGVTGRGYATGGGFGTSSGFANAASYGGQGSNSHTPTTAIAPTYGSYTAPIDLGSGGNCGTNPGGGAVILNVSGVLTDSGTIRADSPPNTGSCAGGSGGSVFLTVGSLAGNGTISAQGGYGTVGGGGGGRISVIGSTATFTGSIQAYGGNQGGASGGAGTIFIQPPGMNANLVIDNNGLGGALYAAVSSADYTSSLNQILFNRTGNLWLPNFSTTTLSTTTFVGDGTTGYLRVDGNLTIPNNFVLSGYGLSLSSMTNLIAANFTVGGASGSVITHDYNINAEIYKATITATSIVIAANGLIDVSGRGYATGYGPGTSSGFANAGSHGGQGSNSNTPGTPVAPTYDSYSAPTNLGSGGNCGSNAGGGAVIVNVTGALTVNGAIRADAPNTGSCAGGSGGSIFLTVGSLAGGGTISAQGAHGTVGGGGGGRISVIGSTAGFSAGTLQAFGGSQGGSSGGAGTIFIQPPTMSGNLIIDDNGLASNLYAVLGTTYTSNSGTFDSITLQRNGKFTTAFGLNAFSTIAVNNGIYGDLSGNATFYGALNLPGSLFTLQGASVTVSSGAIVGSANILMTTSTLLAVSTSPAYVVGNWTLQTGAVLEHMPNTGSTESSWLNLMVTTLTVQSGAMILADGLGYGPSSGPVHGTLAAGGGHGGAGGNDSGSGVGGGANDSALNPANFGSGAGPTHSGGSGGGLIMITSTGTVTINGIVSANGSIGTTDAAGGGAGGSVDIAANVFTGSGLIRALGGNGTTNGGGGGGGRISVSTSGAGGNFTWTGNSLCDGTAVEGGTGFNAGQTGTEAENGGLASCAVSISTTAPAPFVSTTTPIIAWIPVSPTTRLQLATDVNMTNVIADSTTANAYYVSTNSLTDGNAYWFRLVPGGATNWSSTYSFTVDLDSPSFTSPQVSTSASGQWTALPMTTYLSSTVVTARITVQDPVAGLLTSTGLPAGLVDQWHFDESSGTFALDASTTGNNLSVGAGSIAWGAGKQGGALSLNGNTYLQNTAPSGLPLGNAARTYEAWVNLSNTNGGAILYYGNNACTAQEVRFLISSGCGTGAGNTGLCLTTGCTDLGVSYTFAPNVWYRVAFVYDGAGTGKFYVNGQQAGASQNYGSLSTTLSGTSLKIGAAPGYTDFNGLIEDVRVYNVALSPAQVVSDYESDTLAAQNRSAAFHVLYSTNAGSSWNFVSTNSVTLTGGNGTTGLQTLTANNIPLAVSTGPFAATDQIQFVASDMAGNVSTATYIVYVDVAPQLTIPSSGTAVSTTTPIFLWAPGVGSSRLQISANSSFTSNVVDSTTANAYYISTNTLSNGTTYWWRVADNASNWSAIWSFQVDTSSPSYSSPQISTSSTGQWTALPMATYLSSNVVTAQISVQDLTAGLEVSTGLPTGLLGQWHFDESSGTAALDASTNSYNGTLVAGPSWVSGKRGSALSLNGSSQYVTLPDGLLQNLLVMTFEVWFKTTSNGAIIGYENAAYPAVPGSYVPMLYVGTDNKLRAELWNNTLSPIVSAASVNDGAWHHAALTANTNTQSLYLDGVLAGTVAGNITLLSMPSTQLGTAYAGGSWPNTNAGWFFFNGSLDEARLFNVARSSTQILADYQADTLAAHNRTLAYDVLYSTNAGATWSFVSTNSVTLSGSNGTTGTQTLQAANIPLVTSTGPAAATDRIEFVASDMAGNVSTAAYAVLVDTTAPAMPPSCGLGFNVIKSTAGLGPSWFTSIQTAVNALPKSLSTNACVVVRDTQTYSEQVTVQGFAPTGGYTGNLVQIMSDPSFVSSAPVVDPPNGAAAAFQILNASVTILNVSIISTNSVSYGILASSMNVTISSVNIDSGGKITAAGIKLSSGAAAVSYSSITVQGAHGIFLAGSRNSVSYSTAQAASTSFYGLYFNAASSNTISVFLSSNPLGTAVYLDANSINNFISQSTMATSASGYYALSFISGGSSNTVAQSYMSNPTATSVNVGSNNNTISGSTLTTGAGAWNYALYINSSSNTVTQSFLYATSGAMAANINGGVNNTISFSTMVGAQFALDFGGGSSNTVAQSYMSNPTATSVNVGSNNNTISGSTLTTGAGAWNYALSIAASSNTVTQSFLYALNGGMAAVISGGVNNQNNTISFSTMVGTQFALDFGGGSSNTVTQSYMSNPTAASVNVGSNNNTISGSTMTTGGGTWVTGLEITGASSNTVTRSLILAPAGANAAAFDWSSAANTISLSTVNANCSTGWGAAIAFVHNSASNTVLQTYISNPWGLGASVSGTSNGSAIIQSSVYSAGTAVSVTGATGTVIGASVLVATNTAAHAVYLGNGNGDLAVSSSTLSGGPQGAGIYLDTNNTGLLNLSTNTILSGAQYGVYVAAQQAGTRVWIASNTIIPTISNAQTTYGLYFNGLASGATIQNNGVYFRISAPGPTGTNYAYPLYSQSSSGLNINNNRFDNPGMFASGNFGGVTFNGTTGSAFKFNDVNSTGTALANAYLLQLINGSTGNAVKDNVFFSSFAVTASSASLVVDAASNSGLAIDYNDWVSSNNRTAFSLAGAGYQGLTAWQASGFDAHSISANPLWYNAAAGGEDFHPLSQAGRCTNSPACTSWNNDGASSLTIDNGDPSEAIALINLEPSPNGCLANLGSYGETAEASKSYVPSPPSWISPINNAGFTLNRRPKVWMAPASCGGFGTYTDAQIVVSTSPTFEAAVSTAAQYSLASAGWTPAPAWTGGTTVYFTPQLDLTANTTTLYLRSAVTNGSAWSPWSSSLRILVRGDWAWTDNPIVPRQTVIRAAHVNELRTVVQNVDLFRGFASPAWTDPTLTPNQSVIRALHVSELRNFLAPPLTAVGTTPTWTDNPISTNTTSVRAVHITELRTNAAVP